MRKNSRILVGIGVLVLVAVVGGGVLFVRSLRQDSKAHEMVMNSIREDYQKLEGNIGEYNTYRGELMSELDDFYLDDLLNRYEALVGVLEKIDQNIQDSKKLVVWIDDRCQENIFRDHKVNTICDEVDTYYEKLVNLFVGDVKKVNDLISSYNVEYGLVLETYSALWKDYIDYDRDGKYLERDDD